MQATSEKSRDRFAKRKQLMPRERIALLLDRGAPFLELMPLAGYRMHDDKDGSSAGGGSVAGIGYVEGVRCVVTASNSAIKGGTVAPSGQRKGQRIQQVVMENKLPVVNLVESGGANLLYQAEIFVPGGRGFANQARMSARGIPQVTVVHGSSTAGGAYLPGLSDYVIMVRNQAKVFLAGPPLLKAATGEIATDEELGGAEMHATVSGVAEWMAENDADGIRMAREVIAKWHWNDKLPPSVRQVVQGAAVRHRRALRCRAALVQGSLRRARGDRPPGRRLGLPRVQGPLRPADDLRLGRDRGRAGGLHRQQRADHHQGLGQGRAVHPALLPAGHADRLPAEHHRLHGRHRRRARRHRQARLEDDPGGGQRHGAADHHRDRRFSFGAGNYGMCGRAYDPRFIFAWPNNRTAVMGGEQAAGVMKTVTEQKFLREGKEPPHAEIDKMYKGIVAQFDRESTALYGTAHLWDDGIIDPRDTRRILAFTLSIARELIVRPLNPITFGVARM